MRTQNRVVGAAAFMGLFIGIVIALAPATAEAQAQTFLLPPGTRVRVTRPCVEGPRETQRPDRWCPMVGEFVQAQAGILLISVADSTGRYDLDSVWRFEVSRGSGSFRLVGAAAGFLAGVGGSFVVLHGGGSTSLCDRSANQDAMNAGECLGLVALGGLAGASLGAVVGGLIRTERWDVVPLERLRVGLTSARAAAIVVLLKL